MIQAPAKTPAKTDKMRLVELEHGKSLEQLLPRLIRERGGPKGAAGALGVPLTTLWRWIDMLSLPGEARTCGGCGHEWCSYASDAQSRCPACHSTPDKNPDV